MKVLTRAALFAALLAQPFMSVWAECATHGGGAAARIPWLLVAMAVGYWVLTLATEQERPLNIIGRIVGGLIILVTVAGLVCAAAAGYCKWRQCDTSGLCPVTSPKACHLEMNKGHPSAATPAAPKKS